MRLGEAAVALARLGRAEEARHWPMAQEEEGEGTGEGMGNGRHCVAFGMRDCAVPTIRH